MEQFQPKDVLIIEDLNALKVIADPLRTQIIEILTHQPATVKQIADKLGLASSKLYYHVNMLENAGFIVVVETRMVANMQEKYYRTAAKSFDLDESLLSFHADAGQDSVYAALNNILDTTRDDMLRSLQARLFALDQGSTEKKSRFMLTRQTNYISEDRANEFIERLEALLKEFGQVMDADETAVSTQHYAMHIAFYPSIYYPDDKKPDDKK